MTTTRGDALCCARMGHVSASDRALKPVVVRLDEAEFEALRRWAVAEDRSLSAQTRVALRGIVPAKFYDPEAEHA